MKQVEHSLVAEQVLQQLHQLILSKGYQPGDKMLTEKEACELFGVGRSTIREAYKMLQIQGMLESRQGKGSFIIRTEPLPKSQALDANFDEAGLSDFIELRQAVEPMAFARAAQTMKTQELTRLRTVIDKMQKAVNENAVAELVRQDELFHFILVEASGNKIFLELTRECNRFLQPYRVQYFSDFQNAADALEMHKKIFDALIIGDEEAGSKLLRSHVGSPMDKLPGAR